MFQFTIASVALVLRQKTTILGSLLRPVPYENYLFRKWLHCNSFLLHFPPLELLLQQVLGPQLLDLRLFSSIKSVLPPFLFFKTIFFLKTYLHEFTFPFLQPLILSLDEALDYSTLFYFITFIHISAKPYHHQSNLI